MFWILCDTKCDSNPLLQRQGLGYARKKTTGTAPVEIIFGRSNPLDFSTISRHPLHENVLQILHRRTMYVFTIAEKPVKRLYQN